MKYNLRRTNADKRKAVKTLLQDEEWSQNSDNWIAKKARVSNHLVKAVREDLEISKSDVRKTSDGRTIDTTNIGNGSGSDFKEASEKTTEKQEVELFQIFA